MPVRPMIMSHHSGMDDIRPIWSNVSVTSPFRAENVVLRTQSVMTFGDTVQSAVRMRIGCGAATIRRPMSFATWSSMNSVVAPLSTRQRTGAALGPMCRTIICRGTSEFASANIVQYAGRSSTRPRGTASVTGPGLSSQESATCTSTTTP